MRALVLILMPVVYVGSASAATKQSFESRIKFSKKFIGGAVLKIGKKGTITIEQKTENALVKQLGADKKQELYTDLLLETPVSEISKKYSSNKSKDLAEVIAQYTKLFTETKDIASN